MKLQVGFMIFDVLFKHLSSIMAIDVVGQGRVLFVSSSGAIFMMLLVLGLIDFISFFKYDLQFASERSY